MDCLRAGLPGNIENDIALQVAFLGRRAANMHRLIGQTHMHCLTIGIGENRNGANAQTLRCPDDPTGDLATICNQNRRDHRHYILNTPNFVSGTGALSDADRLNARTSRVSEGRMMPSSHSLAVAK